MATQAALAPAPPPVAVPLGDPVVGTTVGGFNVVKQLGVGGMGTVYLGEHAIIGSRVAIKLLHPQLASNPELVQRFFAEARAVNVIGHENIVSIVDLNVMPGNRYYYVMEYLEGQTLQALASRPLDATVAIPILAQVCEALQAAHVRGIVHRDLKPENVFLIKRGRMEHFVKVLDFGIAKLLGNQQGAGRTASGMIIGTPEFMAPEQASGIPVDARADIYALGIVTYLLATGRLPFESNNIAQLLIAHQTEVPPAPHVVNPQVPEAWSLAIMKAIAKRPEDRFQDANGMRDALEAVLTGGRKKGTSVVMKAPLAVEPKLKTPMPTESRHVAPFMARLLLPGAKDAARLRCHDLSRGGVFLVTEGPLPPVFTRLKLLIEVPGQDVEIAAEVVRHVSPEQAKAWNMPAGFGVQFLELTAEKKDVLARVVKGLPLAPQSAVAPTPTDDAEAEKVLTFFRKRIKGDHYVVLAVSSDAELGDVRQRAREAKRELEGLKARPISDPQRAQVDSALERIEQALAVLGQPRPRAEFDAARGNYQGIAKCLSAGLTPTELEALRKRFLAANPRAETTARIHFATGVAWEAQAASGKALEELQKALALDPLNLEYHTRYWGLKRRARA